MQEGTAQGTREKAGAAAETAKEQARTVTEDTKQEVRAVAQEAKAQARNVADELRTDLRDRADTEATKVAQTLKQTGSQLRRMADSTDEGGFPQSLVREGATFAERFADRLESGGVEAVLADFRSFARRNPGTFLMGTAFAGFVAGRLVRNVAGEGMSLSGNGAGNGSGTAMLQRPGTELDLETYAREMETS